MNLAGLSAPDLGRAMSGLCRNLPVRDVAREAAFLIAVPGLVARRVERDDAIPGYRGGRVQLHADATFVGHPLLAFVPETGARGAGIEIRLHETDPDAAAECAAGHPGATLLQPPADKPHGLREAVILSPEGYAWVPSRRL